MKNNASLIYAMFLVIGDFLALLMAFTAAYILRVKLDPRPLIEQIPALTYLRISLIVLPLWILVHSFIGLYSRNIYEKRFSEFGRLIVGSCLGILIVIGYDFVSNKALFPARLVPVYGLGLGFSFLVLFRTLARALRHQLFRYGIGISNVLIIGNTTASEYMAQAINNTSKTGQRVLAVVGREVEHFRYYQTFENARNNLKEPIHSIFQTELFADSNKNNQVLDYAQEHHIAYRFVPGNSDLFVGNMEVEIFSDTPVISIHQTALTGWGRIAKRLFDVIFGGLFLIVLLPLILVIAVLNLMLSGRVFFRQVRLTRFNQRFRVFKFQTVRPTYNGLSPEEAFAKMGQPELAKVYRDNGDYLANDPRISAFGNFLRKTSLDELPQLFNVVKGDLSLVGPRALVPTELEFFAKRHAILSVKSGLTGLAQVSGRRNIDFDERRKLDLFYVQNWSFWMDLVILIKTLRVVLTGSGAK